MTVIRAYVPPEIDLDPFMIEGKHIIGDGGTLEDLWAYLRANGLWLSDSITVTVQLTGRPRRDVKQMVVSSDTWRDMHPAIEELHDSIELALAELEKTGEVKILTSSEPVTSR